MIPRVVPLWEKRRNFKPYRCVARVCGVWGDLGSPTECLQGFLLLETSESMRSTKPRLTSDLVVAETTQIVKV